MTNMKKDERIFEFYHEGILIDTRHLYPETNSDVIRACNKLDVDKSTEYVDIHTGLRWKVKRIK